MRQGGTDLKTCRAVDVSRQGGKAHRSIASMCCALALQKRTLETKIQHRLHCTVQHVNKVNSHRGNRTGRWRSMMDESGQLKTVKRYLDAMIGDE